MGGGGAKILIGCGAQNLFKGARSDPFEGNGAQVSGKGWRNFAGFGSMRKYVEM